MSAIGNIKQWQKEVIYSEKHTLELTTPVNSFIVLVPVLFLAFILSEF